MNLDDALGAWAAQEVALPASTADAVLREILASPVALDQRWWARFAGQLAGNVVASTRPRVPVAVF